MPSSTWLPTPPPLVGRKAEPAVAWQGQKSKVSPTKPQSSKQQPYLRFICPFFPPDLGFAGCSGWSLPWVALNNRTRSLSGCSLAKAPCCPARELQSRPLPETNATELVVGCSRGCARSEQNSVFQENGALLCKSGPKIGWRAPLLKLPRCLAINGLNMQGSNSKTSVLPASCCWALLIRRESEPSCNN